jgi:ribose transport system substrate-binding protein
LSAKPSAGKKIGYLKCSISSCVPFGAQLLGATKVLGWDLKVYNFDNTDPEAVINAMNQAIDDKVAGIVIPGVTPEQITQPLKRAKSAKIPVMINAAVIDATGMDGNGVIGNTNGSKQVSAGAELMAAWVIADSGGKANVAIFTVNDFTSVKITSDTMKAYIDKNCPDCKTQILPQATAAIGTQTPGAVVSLVQQDPSIDYVMFSFGSLASGVAAALKAANLDDRVKVVGTAPVEANFQGVIDGTEAAWGGWSSALQAWDCIDGLARYFVGDSTEPANNQVGPLQIFDGDNRPANADPLFPSNFAELYSHIWKVS